jgi:His-Xaa-Ser system radical SAM maturase HxsC
MLTLAGNLIEHRNFDPGNRIVIRVTDKEDRIAGLRGEEAFLTRGKSLPKGFRAYIALAKDAAILDELPTNVRRVVLPNAFSYLAEGDLLRLWPAKNTVRTLYRRGASYNSFLITERCNHYCLMCSQPPKDVNDGWIIEDIIAALKLVDPCTPEIGLTGGEPTLLGEEFLRVLRVAKSYLPNTALHVLSNGRKFDEIEFAQAYAEIEHPDIMVGIPIYSDLSTIHNYIVQADGAFDQTIRGILNLKRYGQRVEIRVVIHKQTFERLPQLAEFIARNLTFVDQVVLMGLEITGFTKANLIDLWVDPFEYQIQLARAVDILDANRINVSIYNHQLCLIERRLWKYARKSISDWKNEFVAECNDCTERNACGGFFASASIKRSDHIRPFCVEASPSVADGHFVTRNRIKSQ